MSGAREPMPQAGPAELAGAVMSGDRAALARAISLVESSSDRHAAAGDELLRILMPRSGSGVRVGITGVPGAGKSTFIERLGVLLCGRGERVAVLAVDPSSAVSGGSILGDRTRMGKLAAEPNAYIRPSPSGGSLGGVAPRTREAMIVCEAAGFGVVLVETVGVGQSETSVADLVDCVVTLAVPGTGDELQGIKRGLLEVVDVVGVNKSDGANTERAKVAAGELRAALRVLRSADPPPVIACSAATGAGIAEVWDAVAERIRSRRASGALDTRRQEQTRRWLRGMIEARLLARLHASASAAGAMRDAETDLLAGRAAVGAAAERVLAAFLNDGGRA